MSDNKYSGSPLIAETGLSILLLDDQGLVRDGIKALIQACEPKASIKDASSFDGALALLSGQTFDIAFLDIDLKGSKSGVDVLEHIRASNLPTRAIMLSAHQEQSVVLDCIRRGACGYILKQMDSNGLFRRALDTIFQGGVFLPADVLGRRDTLTEKFASLEEIGVRGRALEALYWICQGYSNAVIAYKMGVAESTVANEYNTRLFRQFHVANRASLIVEVARRGIIPRMPEQAVS